MSSKEEKPRQELNSELIVSSQVIHSTTGPLQIWAILERAKAAAAAEAERQQQAQSNFSYRYWYSFPQKYFWKETYSQKDDSDYCP